jgi:predicted kinase
MASAYCHFLIGIPGSGKSTFGSQWIKFDSEYVLVSLDDIKAKLFGDAAIEGNWDLIEAEVVSSVKQAVKSGKSVIYDATNAKRALRMHMLQKFALVTPNNWVGWYMQTPLEKCYQRNRKRKHQVDEAIINSFAQMLDTFEPIEAEGFTKVFKVKPIDEGEFDFQAIQAEIANIPRTITNRRNRNLNKILHQYSNLLNFERLMHLISMLINFPGAGMFHVTNPEFLQNIIGDTTNITESLSEIKALMASLYHPIYADINALAQDLEWLENNGIIGDNNLNKEIDLSEYNGDPKNFDTHTYADADIFTRLIKTIRCLVHYPCFRDDSSDKTSQQRLYEHLRAQIYIKKDTLRRDIQLALHPYKILPHQTMKRAYYIGNNILNKRELTEVFKILESQVEGLEDPLALETYQTFKQKLELSQILTSEQLVSRYPVRAILNQPIFDIDTLPDYTVYKKLDELTAAIEAGQALELKRIPGAGIFFGDPHARQAFRVWPLQIVFHNIGWYLCYECFDGKQKKLLKSERLDRFFITQLLQEQRDISEQKKALSCLEKLYHASGSLFFGHNAEIQQQYLNPKQRTDVEIILELLCNDDIFQFISEGTKRFPSNKIKMSQPPEANKKYSKQTMFSLDKSKDPEFTNRFQVTLPCWVVDDINLLRWIVGFGGNVKVLQPLAIVEKVKSLGDAISKIYDA